MVNKSDILDSLQPFLSNDISVEDETVIRELHTIFCNDFLAGEVFLDDKRVKIKPYPYNRAQKDMLPDWYNGLNEKFVHIITREVKASSNKTSRQIREFRSERALRIHWIKPILENCDDKRIRRFKYIEYTGREREYFWFNKGYMVIVEFINPDVALITGFCVDESNHAYYMRKYTNRIK